MEVNVNIGTIIGNKYRIIKLIGKGSVGTVYEAIAISDNIPVAIKLSDNIGSDLVKQRVAREIRIYASN